MLLGLILPQDISRLLESLQSVSLGVPTVPMETPAPENAPRATLKMEVISAKNVPETVRVVPQDLPQPWASVSLASKDSFMIPQLRPVPLVRKVALNAVLMSIPALDALLERLFPLDPVLPVLTTV